MPTRRQFLTGSVAAVAAVSLPALSRGETVLERCLRTLREAQVATASRHMTPLNLVEDWLPRELAGDGPWRQFQLRDSVTINDAHFNKVMRKVYSEEGAKLVRQKTDTVEQIAKHLGLPWGECV